jgi:copper transporter 1
MMLQIRSPKTAAALLVMVAFMMAHPITAQTTSPCFENPTQQSCRSFTMPEQDILTQLTGLCTAMPYMVGCSLWNSCKSSTADGLYCQPMSLYGTICEEMSEMTDCTPYNQLCFTPGSVVEQCKNPGPLPGAVTTTKTVEAVLNMCSTHSMVGCEDCTARSSCPTPLETLSKLCHSMPGMAQCAGFFTMCSNSAVESTFNTICDEDDNDPTVLPPMKMWMHAGIRDILLFKEWIPENGGEYAGYCILCIVAALVVQGLKAWRVRLEARWAAAYRIPCCETAACGTNIGAEKVPDVYVGASNNKRSASAASSEGELSSSSEAELAASTLNNNNRTILGGGTTCCGGDTIPDSTESIITGAGTSGATNNLRRRNKNTLHRNNNQQGGEIAVGGMTHRWRFIIPSNEQMIRNVIRSAFTFVIVFLDYMLMLIVMSFNIGIIFSTVAGFALGALLFGHFGERVGTGSAVAAGNLAPDSENDLEVHFMEAQTCCNSSHV